MGLPSSPGPILSELRLLSPTILGYAEKPGLCPRQCGWRSGQLALKMGVGRGEAAFSKERENKMYSNLRQHLRQIYQAGLASVDPYAMVRRHARLEGGRLHIAADQGELIYNLDDYRRVLVLGVGKAAAPMALAMEDILGGRLTDGCVVVKYGHCQDLRTICLLEAGHPLPDAEGVRAAQRIVGLAEQADGDCLVINLISGRPGPAFPLWRRRG